MGLGLFSKGKKESSEEKDTLDIKNSASSNSDLDTNENNFVNPFREGSKNQSINNNFDPFKGNPNEPSNDDYGNISNLNQFSMQNQMPSAMGNQNRNQTPTFPNSNQNNLQMPNQTMQMNQFNEPQNTGFEMQNQGNIFQTQNPTQQTQMNGYMQEESKEEIQEMIDETVEKIIEEKWERIINNIEKVVKWKDDVESQIDLLKTDIGTIKENVEKIEKKIMNRLSEYDRDIIDVGSEIKALEKVFQKITPTLVNNVNELSKIAKTLKGEKGSSNMREIDDEEFEFKSPSSPDQKGQNI